MEYDDDVDGVDNVDDDVDDDDGEGDWQSTNKLQFGHNKRHGSQIRCV
jgi:hypothetical protein